MYKNYQSQEFYETEKKCIERIRSLIKKRIDELDELREDINDRYPFEDLFMKWHEVDFEKELLEQLLRHPMLCTVERTEK